MVSISNLGVAKTGPTVEDSGSLLLEYVNGSACTTSYGRRTTYTTRIHLVCSRGSLVRRGSLPDPESGFFRLRRSQREAAGRVRGAPQLRCLAPGPVLVSPARDGPHVPFRRRACSRRAVRGPPCLPLLRSVSRGSWQQSGSWRWFSPKLKVMDEEETEVWFDSGPRTDQEGFV